MIGTTFDLETLRNISAHFEQGNQYVGNFSRFVIGIVVTRNDHGSDVREHAPLTSGTCPCGFCRASLDRAAHCVS